MLTFSRYLTLVALPPSLVQRWRSCCDYLAPEFLSSALRCMPLLTGLTISAAGTEEYGMLPWPTLKLILATPNLRELQLAFTASRTLGLSVEELDIAVPPLISFSYWISSSRNDPRWHPTERDSLAFVLQKISHSLQHLSMSIEPAPLDFLRESHWPHLHDLVLRGEAASHLETPYVITLGNMSELRSLELGLRLLPGVAAPVVSPPAYDEDCPWPHLQSFTVCHPNHEDEIYRHLPPTLQRLALCSYPHHYDIIWEPLSWGGGRSRQHLHVPLLTASQMLELLSQCHTPALAELAIEFLADDRELDLWQYLPRAFPRLSSLNVNVYRAIENHSDIPVVSTHSSCTGH